MARLEAQWQSIKTKAAKGGAPALLHNGVYELNLETETLAMIEANDPSQIAYEWRILNANTLQLVRQDTPSGGNYVGATLSRDFDWDELVDNSPVPTVGTLSHGRR